MQPRRESAHESIPSSRRYHRRRNHRVRRAQLSIRSNRRYTEQIEAIGRAQAREERMSRAEAADVATRNAPKNVSTTTVFAPRF
jgi:hypothetical protein